MPSDKHNSITGKATGLIFSLFDVASVWEVPLGIPQYVNAFFMDLPMSSFVFHSFLLTVKGVNLVVHVTVFLVQWILSVIFIVATYFDYRGAF